MQNKKTEVNTIIDKLIKQGQKITKVDSNTFEIYIGLNMFRLERYLNGFDVCLKLSWKDNSCESWHVLDNKINKGLLPSILSFVQSHMHSNSNLTIRSSDLHEHFKELTETQCLDYLSYLALQGELKFEKRIKNERLGMWCSIDNPMGMDEEEIEELPDDCIRYIFISNDVKKKVL